MERSNPVPRWSTRSIELFVSLLVGCVGILGVVHARSSAAELIDRGGGLIYDTTLDVTWLQDANYASTSGFDYDGRMIWPRAMSWVSELEYYDSVRGRTWTDWRLPSARDFETLAMPCFGYACPKGELGHLYLGHGVTPLAPAPFINVAAEAYWYETMRAPILGLAWIFQFLDGKQDHTGPFEESLVGYSWPVRDGDVAGPPPQVSTGGIGTSVLSLILGGTLSARAIARIRSVDRSGCG